MKRLLIENCNIKQTEKFHKDWKVVSVYENFLTLIFYNPISNDLSLYTYFYDKEDKTYFNLRYIFNDIYLDNKELLDGSCCGETVYRIKIDCYKNGIFDYDSMEKYYKNLNKNKDGIILECERVSDLIYSFLKKNDYKNYKIDVF